MFQVSSKKGFTLIELLVSISIFTVIFGAMAGILIFNIRVQREMLIELEALDEINFAIEYMSRALRLAVKEDGSFNCLTNDFSYQSPGGDSSKIRFINYLQGSDCQEFFLENDILWYKKGIGVSEQTFALTSPGLIIDDLIFNLLGAVAGDGLQPRATMILRASHAKIRSPFDIQTTVSQRKLDVD